MVKKRRKKGNLHRRAGTHLPSPHKQTHAHTQAHTHSPYTHKACSWTETERATEREIYWRETNRQEEKERKRGNWDKESYLLVLFQWLLDRMSAQGGRKRKRDKEREEGEAERDEGTKNAVICTSPSPLLWLYMAAWRLQAMLMSQWSCYKLKLSTIYSPTWYSVIISPAICRLKLFSNVWIRRR